jgi:hypothetical protein
MRSLQAMIAAMVALVVAVALSSVGQLDEAAAAFVQILGIPLKIIGLFLTIVPMLLEGLRNNDVPVRAAGDSGGSRIGWIIVTILAVIAARLWAPTIIDLRRRRSRRPSKPSTPRTKTPPLVEPPRSLPSPRTFEEVLARAHPEHRTR